jgi:rhodanese-related sulfurtransferase
MNLRIAPSARAANSLLLLPPFPPAAERCAFSHIEGGMTAWKNANGPLAR